MFNTLDWIIGFYCVGIVSLTTYIQGKSGEERSAEDYF